jgi:hypothetical protein
VLTSACSSVAGRSAKGPSPVPVADSAVARPARATSGGAVAIAPATPAPDTITRRTVATSMFGDNAVVINERSDGRIEIAAAGEKQRVTVTVPARALLAWADTTTAILSRRVAAPKPPETTRLVRSLMVEPELVGGGLTLTRRVHRGGSSYSLFFADSAFGGLSVPLTKRDAGVFLSAAQRAARAIIEAERPPRAKTPAKKKPKPKKPKVPAASTPPAARG